MNSSVFNTGLYKCKAVLLEDNKTIVTGYYHNAGGKDWIDEDRINPYTLCRNTGIPLKNEFLYEYDLIEYKSGLSDWQLGFIEWDDYSRCYSVRSSLNYSSRRDIRSLVIRVIGNITLSYSDMDKMQKYSDDAEKDYSTQTAPVCRSTQHLNKNIKRFLP